MKKIIIFISILSFISCTKKNNNAIDLFNGISFEMQTGEALIEIKPNINELYSEYFNNRQPQVPLFKYIKHSNYKIFIGIPYDTSINKMIKTQLEKPDSSRVFFESSSNYFFTKYKKDGFYIAEYATVFKNNAIIYISSMTDRKEISDSLFNKLKISKRLKLKNN